MYNNCMSAFDPRPGARNSVAPGKARTTAVAETVVLRDGAPFLVLGSPGAARITAGLVEVLVNVVDFGMNAAEAVVCPRFDAYGERRLVLDSRFPLPLVANLRERGWDVQQSPKPFGSVGRVYAVEVEPHGRRVAGVDPGEPGAAFRTG
jgi:gamma-glutamyltranspeptidase/glutathione hydrolase